MQALLEVKNLSKRYQDNLAVDNISFGLQANQCLGLLGPNGAGKTTTVEMLEGITDATHGDISYKGTSIGKQFKLEAGIMFQSTALQEFITVKETLILFQNLYPNKVPLQQVIKTCVLEELLDRDNRKLSGGQKQRLLLAIALINDPKILFLDEPTTGLDPQSRRNFWDLIKTIKKQGKTVLLTTHYMEEAQELCDQLIIMDHGKIIAEGSPKQLLNEHFKEVVVEIPASNYATANTSLPANVQEHEGLVSIATTDINATIKSLMSSRIPLDDLHVRKPSLDDLFLKLTGNTLRS